jgi:hypothetical protein
MQGTGADAQKTSFTPFPINYKPSSSGHQVSSSKIQVSRKPAVFRFRGTAIASRSFLEITGVWRARFAGFPETMGNDRERAPLTAALFFVSDFPAAPESLRNILI